MSSGSDESKLMAAVERDPWERMPGEPSRGYAAFIAYRDMGPSRSIRAVGQQLGKSATLMATWSSRWRWVDRCAAWEDHQDAVRRAEQLDAIREMNDYHARLSRQMLNVVVRRIVGDETRGIPPLDPNKLSPSDCARMTDIAAKLERLSRGAPDSVVEERHVTAGEPGRVSRAIFASDDALAKAMELLDDIADAENAASSQLANARDTA